jgi:hypothetical protein
LAESTAGAQLDEKEARALAIAALLEYGMDPQNFTMVEASSTERPARIDHHFVFQARDGDRRNLEQLYYRISIEVAGDEVVGFYRHLKLPEAWTRARSEDSYFKKACSGILVAALLALILHALWLLVRFVRRDAIHWRSAHPWAVAVALLAFLNYGNNFVTLTMQYNTRLSLYVFIIMQTLIAAFALLGILLSYYASFGLITGAFAHWRAHLQAAMGRAAFADALLRALLFTVAAASTGRLLDLARTIFIRSDPSPSLALPLGLDALAPFFAGLTQALFAALLAPMALATLAYYYHRHLNGNRRSALSAALVLCLLTAGASAHGAGEFAFALCANLATATAFIALCYYFLHTHLLAYSLAVFVATAGRRAWGLLSLEADLYTLHGIALLLAAILCILYLWRRAVGQRAF